MTTFALGDVVLVALSAAFALAGGWAADAWGRGRSDPVAPTRAAAVSGALMLALWETAGRGPQVSLSVIVGVLLVSLLALLGVETLMIVLDPHDNRDPRAWIAAFVLAITVGGALALVA